MSHLFSITFYAHWKGIEWIWGYDGELLFTVCCQVWLRPTTSQGWEEQQPQLLHLLHHWHWLWGAWYYRDLSDVFSTPSLDMMTSHRSLLLSSPPVVPSFTDPGVYAKNLCIIQVLTVALLAQTVILECVLRCLVSYDDVILVVVLVVKL